MPRRHLRATNTQLTAFERGRIVGLSEAGMSSRDVAARVGRNSSTVIRCWNQWQREHSQTRRRGSGSNRITTDRQDRHIRRMALANRSSTSSEIRNAVAPAIGRPISAMTVRRRIQEVGLTSRRPLQRLPLLPHHRSARLRWCRARQHWRDEWRSIVFSDESRFSLGQHDGRIRVWRRTGERSISVCIAQRNSGHRRV